MSLVCTGIRNPDPRSWNLFALLATLSRLIHRLVIIVIQQSLGTVCFGLHARWGPNPRSSLQMVIFFHCTSGDLLLRLSYIFVIQDRRISG